LKVSVRGSVGVAEAAGQELGQHVAGGHEEGREGVAGRTGGKTEREATEEGGARSKQERRGESRRKSGTTFFFLETSNSTRPVLGVQPGARTVRLGVRWDGAAGLAWAW